MAARNARRSIVPVVLIVTGAGWERKTQWV